MELEPGEESKRWAKRHLEPKGQDPGEATSYLHIVRVSGEIFELPGCAFGVGVRARVGVGSILDLGIGICDGVRSMDRGCVLREMD